MSKGQEWTPEAMAAKLTELKAVSAAPAPAPAPARAAPAPAADVKAPFKGFKPTIDINRPRYDQSQFFGRMRHFLDVIGTVRASSRGGRHFILTPSFPFHRSADAAHVHLHSELLAVASEAVPKR
jgi:hypothetical protein